MDIDRVLTVYAMWLDRRERNGVGLAEITIAIDSLNRDELRIYSALKGAYLYGFLSNEKTI